jgi:hypothetical protein
MKTAPLAFVFVLLLSAAVLPSLPSVGAASDESLGFPQLAMPVEHINYTIVSVNGTLWAEIDGEYPITIQNQFNGDLPMVYPMPPQTTNIYVWLDGQELGWSNFTQSNPEALHQTAIGDWWMIYSVLPQVSGSFMLRIHYEHPLEIANASYLFLYDLNISPYLSEQNTNSTAYFTVQIPSNATDVRAYTALPESAANEWKPLNYTIATQDDTTIVSIPMYSEYPALSGKPLPGDLVVEFSAANPPSAFPLWVIAVSVVVIVGLVLAVVVYSKRRR